jgi:soluble lytic murein transglycosylase-like protein
MVRIGMAITTFFMASILNPVEIGNSDHHYNVSIEKDGPKTYRSVNHAIQQPNKKYWNVPVSHNLQDYIHNLCAQYHVDEKLVYAVMKTESNFNPNRVSDTNDYGLFQINQINFQTLNQEIGFNKPLDSFQNSKAGVYMLSKLQKTFQDKNMVILAYNRGTTGARDLASRGITLTDYVQKVNHNMQLITKA